MKNQATKAITLLLAAGLSTGCMVDADEAPEVEDPIVETEAAARSALVAQVTGLSWSRGEFSVDVEVSSAVTTYHGYLVTELQYIPVGGAGVSPFAAVRPSQVHFRQVGRNTYAATLYVTAPEPRDINDVQSWVSANPTPHP